VPSWASVKEQIQLAWLIQHLDGCPSLALTNNPFLPVVRPKRKPRPIKKLEQGSAKTGMLFRERRWSLAAWTEENTPNDERPFERYWKRGLSNMEEPLREMRLNFLAFASESARSAKGGVVGLVFSDSSSSESCSDSGCGTRTTRPLPFPIRHHPLLD
jgi:hypothetical protein